MGEFDLRLWTIWFKFTKNYCDVLVLGTKFYSKTFNSDFKLCLLQVVKDLMDEDRILSFHSIKI